MAWRSFCFGLASPGAGVGKRVEAVYTTFLVCLEIFKPEYIPSRTLLGLILISCNLSRACQFKDDSIYCVQ